MGRRVLLLTDEFDSAGRLLARRLGSEVITVTPRDLSRQGWTFHPEPWRRTGATSGGVFTIGDLGVVVTRLQGVYAGHLPQIAIEDRDYVAAEMTAFLRAWLTGLPLPVFEPPTSLSLSAPAWTPEQWAFLAARHGIAFAPTRRSIKPTVATCAVDAARVVVAGNRHLSDVAVPTSTVQAAQALAAAAGRRCLEARVAWLEGGPHLCEIRAWPDLADEAVLEFFCTAVDAARSEGAR